MRCPFCQCEDTQVKDSRPTEDGSVIRRRRICSVCGGRFTTFERVQLRELMVIKKSGRHMPFDREKLMRSIDVALRKREIDKEKIDRAVSGIVRQLESSGEVEVTSEEIGRLVMEALKRIDDIAYIRFASVYRNFSSAQDFHNIIDEVKISPIDEVKE
ncbi:MULTISPECIES: transcriptional regulator NrdR [unclassified Bartonella]|uniref:transcriptional regulator NrdR n=1 Tax=unclassified Bartonella TaxID=2645622 RepID=UPI0015F8FE8C|nr:MULTISPECIES: transcriptional regulator NrdR [unclassified Bartonella]UXN04497.1 transcriptional regulator NrdR [Bartonella sp. HY406]UXN07490.1 transcriptional regulator NrdR [Bartonella sp. HY761]